MTVQPSSLFGASATFKPALDKACRTGQHYPSATITLGARLSWPRFPMIWRQDPSNASSRQGKSRTACLAKKHPVLNCAEALNLLLRSHRLAGEHPSWSVKNNEPSLIEAMALGAVMAMSRFPKRILSVCVFLAVALTVPHPAFAWGDGNGPAPGGKGILSAARDTTEVSRPPSVASACFPCPSC